MGKGWVEQPTPVPLVDQVRHLAMGTDDTCAIRRDGTARCWGRLANAPRQTVELDVREAGAVTVPFGGSTVVVMRADGSLSIWNRSSASALVPFHGAQYDALKVASGYAGNCVITKDSVVHCWDGFTTDVMGMTVVTPPP